MDESFYIFWRIKKMADKQLNDQEIVRREKMEDLRSKGIDPFGHGFKRTHTSKELANLYSEKTSEELEALK